MIDPCDHCNKKLTLFRERLLSKEACGICGKIGLNCECEDCGYNCCEYYSKPARLRGFMAVKKSMPDYDPCKHCCSKVYGASAECYECEFRDTTGKSIKDIEARFNKD